MPCDWKEMSEPYNDEKFSEDLKHFGEKGYDIYTTDDERDAMSYIINETDHFMLDVYDKEHSTTTSFFSGHPMGSTFLLSDTFARKYSNSLYTFIELRTDGYINKDDIGGVTIHWID